MRFGDGNDVDIFHHLDSDTLGLAQQVTDEGILGDDHRGVDGLTLIDGLDRHQTLLVQPVQVHHEELIQFFGRETRLRGRGQQCGHEVDGLLDLVHRARCHGVQTARLSTHGERRDEEHRPGGQHDEQPDHDVRLLLISWRPDGGVASYTREMTERRGRTREGTEEALREAGYQLILERGYENISTRDVADRAGCNHGLITQYFGTKAILFTRVLHRLADEIGETIAAGTSIPVLNRLPIMNAYWRLLASLLSVGVSPEQTLAAGTPTVKAMVQRAQSITGRSIEDSRAFAAAIILMIGGFHVFGPVFEKELSGPNDANDGTSTLQRAAWLILNGLTTPD